MTDSSEQFRPIQRWGGWDEGGGGGRGGGGPSIRERFSTVKMRFSKAG